MRRRILIAGALIGALAAPTAAGAARGEHGGPNFPPAGLSSSCGVSWFFALPAIADPTAPGASEEGRQSPTSLGCTGSEVHRPNP